jgi:hypothetical protein
VSPRPDAAGPPTGPTSEATAEALDAASTLGGLAPERPTYGASARILGIGIAITGVVTFGYFAVASYVLTPAQYGRIALLWSILFVTMSVIYRPVEQLLSRAIARRRAIDPGGSDQLKRPALIQLSFAAAFLIVSLIFRGRLPCIGSLSDPDSRTRRRTSPVAFSPGTNGSSCTADSCCSKRSRGFSSRSGSPSGWPPDRPL